MNTSLITANTLNQESTSMKTEVSGLLNYLKTVLYIRPEDKMLNVMLLLKTTGPTIWRLKGFIQREKEKKTFELSKTFHINIFVFMAVMHYIYAAKGFTSCEEQHPLLLEPLNCASIHYLLLLLFRQGGMTPSIYGRKEVFQRNSVPNKPIL